MINQDKLDKIIDLIEVKKSKNKVINYRSGITMFDLEGTYTLVEIFPPLPINIPGCSYNVGDYGIIIDPINAFVGRAQYTLPMGSSEIHLDYFKETNPKFYNYVISQGYTETCLDLGDTQNINLYGIWPLHNSVISLC